MNWAFHSLDIAWGILCAIGWILGVLAWVRQGFGVPRAVHITALVLCLIGALTTLLALRAGIRSLGFTAFALIGFPVWAYIGWFFCGCPPEDQKRKGGYDISQALKHYKK